MRHSFDKTNNSMYLAVYTMTETKKIYNFSACSLSRTRPWIDDGSYRFFSCAISNKNKTVLFLEYPVENAVDENELVMHKEPISETRPKSETRQMVICNSTN